MKPVERENERYKDQEFGQTSMEKEILLSQIKNMQSKHSTPLSILDIGCGSGVITKKIQDAGVNVEGIDFSENAIKKARARGLNAKVWDLDNKRMSYEDNTFDAAVAIDVLEHVFDPMNVIKELGRITKPGSNIFVTIPNDVSLFVRIKTLLGISYQEGHYRRNGMYKHHTFFSIKLLSYMLERGNFSITKKTNITNYTSAKQYGGQTIPLFLTSAFAIIAKNNKT